MSELHARGTRALYDHEQEDGHSLGRRRPAADWGVGEELFDRMPSRRRFRAGEPSPSPRRDAHEAARHEATRHEAPSARHEAPSARHEAPRRDTRRREPVRAAATAPPRPRPAVDHDRPTDELTLPSRPHDDATPAGTRPSDVDAWMAELAGATVAEPEPTAAPEDEPAASRRTVVIRGRGAEAALPAARRERRPPRTVGERLGPRPDRVAAWAVALGVLLILIAILTSH